MDENLEKKPKRPRIDEAKPAIEDTESPRYERSGYGQPASAQAPQHANYQGGGYQRSSYNRPSYGGGYQPRYSQSRYNPTAADTNPISAEGANPENASKPQIEGQGEEEQQQPRQSGYQPRQGGYQPRPGGYQPQHPKQKHSQGPRPQMRFIPRPQPVEYEMPIIDPNTEIRLNKFMANAGICSRREADELITKGLIKVNGEVVTELGVKITPKDTVEYNDKEVMSERKVYILLNKPKDCVTTSDDPNGRKTVMDIIKGACEERIYPVGRLDRNTTGVLLLTNDGDLASKLTHPKYVK